MGDLYVAGLAIGIATAAGVLVGGLAGAPRVRATLGVIIGAAAGFALAWFVSEPWAAAVAAAAGALAALAASRLGGRAIEGGGTGGGVRVLLAAAALALAAIALVPFLGYVEAVIAPALALRMRRRESGRYAGLRILSRD